MKKYIAGVFMACALIITVPSFAYASSFGDAFLGLFSGITNFGQSLLAAVYYPFGNSVILADGGDPINNNNLGTVPNPYNHNNYTPREANNNTQGVMNNPEVYPPTVSNKNLGTIPNYTNNNNYTPREANNNTQGVVNFSLSQVVTGIATPSINTVEGTVTTTTNSAIVWFEYGTSSALGSKSGTQTVGAGTTKTFSKTLFGLLPNKTYYYRAVANSQNQTSFGDIRTFVSSK